MGGARDLDISLGLVNQLAVVITVILTGKAIGIPWGVVQLQPLIVVGPDADGVVSSGWLVLDEGYQLKIILHVHEAEHFLCDNRILIWT